MTDYPDFAPAVSPAPVTFVKALGPFGAGVAWGPVTVPMPSGGAYEIVLFSSNNSQYAITDITVSHLDSRNVPTWQDFFGGVLAGNGLPGVAAGSNAAICRGNIYGTSLQVSGSSASSAYLNAVIPGFALTASGLVINVNSTPFALDDPLPKVSAAAAALGNVAGLTPQGLLAVMNDQSVAVSANTTPLPLLAYAGPVTVTVEQTGIAAAVNAQLRLLGYTVAGGSAAAVTQRRYKGLATGQVSVFPDNLPPLLTTYIFSNADPANAGVVSMAITAGRAA